MSDRNVYIKARDELLRQIAEALANEERFIAAWLTGSYGRGEVDPISDIDLNAVVADESLLSRPWESGGQTTSERYRLFSRFGQVGILFEAHSNAPPGGTFTTVFYANTGVPVDWILLPIASATRPAHSKLLFEKVPIPMQREPGPESLEERIEQASLHVAYFWMMMATIVRYIVRRDAVAFHLWLNAQHDVLQTFKRMVAGRPPAYKAGSYVELKPTVEEQKRAIRELCEKMLAAMPAVVAMGGTVPEDPMAIVEIRLALVQEE